MNFIFKIIIIIILAVAVFSENFVYASEKPEKQFTLEKNDKTYFQANSSENSKSSSSESVKKINNGENPNSSAAKTDKDAADKKADSKSSPNAPVKKESIKKDSKTDKKPEKPPRRSLQISDAFIITDKTMVNSIRLNSKKKWTSFSDNVFISYDLFGEKDDLGKRHVKKNRLEFNYKFYFSNFSKKEPFLEYCYSSDKPTKLVWKVLSGGLAKMLPLGIKFGLGYGYKWGTIAEKEAYKYDVVTLNLNNEKKFSKITFKQNFKNITPRRIDEAKQPIYDYRSSLSTPITKNLNGSFDFDWRYQKIPETKKADWFNYSLKFGLTFSPIK